MKKNIIISCSLMLSLLLFSPGCQKEIKDPANAGATDAQFSNLQADKNKCRLTSLFNESSETFHYNNNGLCDKWDFPEYGFYIQMEYDASGKLKTARWYQADVLAYTINFYYQKGKVTKEIWYYENTTNVFDEVHYTFNSQGLNTRMESFIQDYYTVNTFDGPGNVISWDFYTGGLHVYSAKATYGGGRIYKNPNQAIPGLEYGFIYLNAAVFSNPFVLASEKLVTYDEDGNPIPLYDFDPSRTSYEPAAQDYPASGTFYDLVSEGWVNQTFEYANCGSGHANSNNPQSAAPHPATGMGKINLMRFHLRSPGKTMKEQLIEFRQQAKKQGSKLQ